MARTEKELVDYQSQADRPFEHEERLKQLLNRQSELNSLLDLDEGDQQGVESVSELQEEPEAERAAPTLHEAVVMSQKWPKRTCRRREPLFEKYRSPNASHRKEVQCPVRRLRKMKII